VDDRRTLSSGRVNDEKNTQYHLGNPLTDPHDRKLRR